MSEKKKILIVDDSATIRGLIKKDLQFGDYILYEAADGKEAIEMLLKVEPDLITLDIEMPDMNGYEVCRKIRDGDCNFDSNKKGLAQIPIIFVTANDTIEEREKGFVSGATDFIVKPFLRGEVFKHVKKILTPPKLLHGIKALIVDDSMTARNILVKILKEQGVDVVEKVNGKEAIEYFKEYSSEINLIITDYEMPEMNGYEFCKIVRGELNKLEVPIIFLTAMSERGVLLKAFKAGATDYLIKPFAKEELIARLGVHLREKMLKDELHEKVLALKKINKLKDDFLSITTHDLRSPLSGVLGFAELLLEMDGLNEEAKEFAGYIISSGNFLLTLINELLDLGKLESNEKDLKLEPLEIKSIIKDCMETLQHMASPKLIQLKEDFQIEGEVWINGNQNALFRIFNNLLSNAIKFTPRSGNVTLCIEMGLNPKTIHAKIIDTGIGIPEKNVPMLFDKFSKVSQQGTEGEKSTGLGMMITKGLIEGHQGQIQVSSEVGKGTTMTFVIPLQKIVSKSAHETQTENLDPATQNSLPNLIEILEGEITQTWKDLTQFSTPNEIETFLDNVKAASANFPYKPLIDWEDALRNQVHLFEMDKIFQDLKLLPDIITEAKTLI